MARVTVEDCLDLVENRFELVLMATRRARQLANGAQSQVPEHNDKVTVLALREISTGLVGDELLTAGIPVPEEEEAATAEALDAELAQALQGGL